MKIGIVVSEFNYDINMMMLELAKEHAAFLDAEVTQVVKVPGIFEVPVTAKKLLEKVDGVVALGAVIEGETDHDEVIINQAARKLMDISLETGKPVGFAITGPGMTRQQAQNRIESAKQAVEVVVKMHKRLGEI